MEFLEKSKFLKNRAKKFVSFQKIETIRILNSILVPEERLELSRRTAAASKTAVSTISPSGQVKGVYGKYE